MPYNHEPMFITNHTNKAKYRDSVAKWTAMFCLMSAEDPKAQARLYCVRLMLYLAADDNAKETIKQAETKDDLILEGSAGDQDRTKIVQTIVDIIATEYPTKNIQKEVNMIFAIESCKRKPS